MQQITSLYRYVVLVFNVSNKSIKEETIVLSKFRESIFDWRHLNN